MRSISALTGDVVCTWCGTMSAASQATFRLGFLQNASPSSLFQGRAVGSPVCELCRANLGMDVTNTARRGFVLRGECWHPQSAIPRFVLTPEACLNRNAQSLLPQLICFPPCRVSKAHSHSCTLWKCRFSRFVQAQERPPARHSGDVHLSRPLASCDMM